MIDWFEEGRADFLKSIVHPHVSPYGPPFNYPTRDKHTEQEEYDYLRGLASAKFDHENGTGLVGLGAYTLEAKESN